MHRPDRANGPGSTLHMDLWSFAILSDGIRVRQLLKALYEAATVQQTAAARTARGG